MGSDRGPAAWARALVGSDRGPAAWARALVGSDRGSARTLARPVLARCVARRWCLGALAGEIDRVGP